MDILNCTAKRWKLFFKYEKQSIISGYNFLLVIASPNHDRGLKNLILKKRLNNLSICQLLWLPKFEKLKNWQQFTWLHLHFFVVFDGVREQIAVIISANTGFDCTNWFQWFNWMDIFLQLLFIKKNQCFMDNFL
jgi:hypothetical protein